MSKANTFLMVNLGCEMIYVIDQRLRAQSISVERSSNLLRDLTCVLVDPRFLRQLMTPPPRENVILDHQQTRILLTDIACCSIMRLDVNSMDKLWDLMVMVFKWQLFMAREPADLLDITFRHLDGIGKLLPESKKTLVIDCARQTILEFWNNLKAEDKASIFASLRHWLKPYKTKISVLIRLGFQTSQGSFEGNLGNEVSNVYRNKIGENIYVKQATVPLVRSSSEVIFEKAPGDVQELEGLTEQLNFGKPKSSVHSAVTNKIILEDMQGATSFDRDSPSQDQLEGKCEFVQIQNKTVDKIIASLNNSSSDDLKPDIDSTDELLRMLNSES